MRWYETYLLKQATPFQSYIPRHGFSPKNPYLTGTQESGGIPPTAPGEGSAQSDATQPATAPEAAAPEPGVMDKVDMPASIASSIFAFNPLARLAGTAYGVARGASDPNVRQQVTQDALARKGWDHATHALGNVFSPVDAGKEIATAGEALTDADTWRGLKQQATGVDPRTAMNEEARRRYAARQKQPAQPPAAAKPLSGYNQQPAPASAAPAPAAQAPAQPKQQQQEQAKKVLFS